MHKLQKNIKVNFQIQIVGKVEIWVIWAFSLDSSSMHIFHIIGAYILVQSAMPFQYVSFF